MGFCLALPGPPGPVAPLSSACLASVAAPAAAKTTVHWCDARFLVRGARLTLAPAAAPGFDVVALEDQHVRIGDCPAVTPKGKVKRGGSMLSLRAKWRGCGGFK